MIRAPVWIQLPQGCLAHWVALMRRIRSETQWSRHSPETLLVRLLPRPEHVDGRKQYEAWSWMNAGRQVPLSTGSSSSGPPIVLAPRGLQGQTQEGSPTLTWSTGRRRKPRLPSDHTGSRGTSE